MRIRLYTFLAAALLISGHLPVLASNGQQVRDEWEPVDRIVVATNPDKTLSPLVRTVIGAAVSWAVLRVVIVDDDPASQQAILTNLQAGKFVTEQTKTYVQFTNTPHNTSWARDEAPIVTFDTKTNKATLTATLFEPQPVPPPPTPVPSHSEEIVKDVGAAVKLPTASVPTITFSGTPPPTLPLSADGGDWMTTDGGKTLITTTNIYDNNGGVGEKASIDKVLQEKLALQRSSRWNRST